MVIATGREIAPYFATTVGNGTLEVFALAECTQNPSYEAICNGGLWLGCRILTTEVVVQVNVFGVAIKAIASESIRAPETTHGDVAKAVGSPSRAQWVSIWTTSIWLRWCRWVVLVVLVDNYNYVHGQVTREEG